MTLNEFKKTVDISIERLCKEFYHGHRDTIKIKKEHVAIKNLVTIIDTTISLSCDKGFDSMSLRDLVRETGLSMGALYSYFSSKDDLLHMIQTQGQRIVKEIILEEIEKESAPWERLQTAIRIHLYLSELMQKWFYFFFMETKNLNKKHRKIPIESELLTESILTDILKQGIKEDVFTDHDMNLTGSALKALMQDWYLKRWKYQQRKVSVEDYVDFIIDMVRSFIYKKTEAELVR